MPFFIVAFKANSDNVETDVAKHFGPLDTRPQAEHFRDKLLSISTMFGAPQADVEIFELISPQEIVKAPKSRYHKRPESASMDA